MKINPAYKIKYSVRIKKNKKQPVWVNTKTKRKFKSRNNKRHWKRDRIKL